MDLRLTRRRGEAIGKMTATGSRLTGNAAIFGGTVRPNQVSKSRIGAAVVAIAALGGWSFGAMAQQPNALVFGDSASGDPAEDEGLAGASR